MSNTSPSRLRLLLLSGLVALPLLCLAAKEFSMPKVQPAASYPNHDYHSKEKVTVALDPYDNADKRTSSSSTTTTLTCCRFC